MGSRKGLSTVLIFGSLVLVLAIVVGNKMGNRVLGQIGRHAEDNATPIPIPTSSASDTLASRALWKRRAVLSVATDPAFPDPRITPEPAVPATPRPRPPTPRAALTPIPLELVTDPPISEESSKAPYTSPPLAIPITSHAKPDPTPSPTLTDEPHASSPLKPARANRAASIDRAIPSLPPVAVPSLNP